MTWKSHVDTKEIDNLGCALEDHQEQMPVYSVLSKIPYFNNTHREKGTSLKTHTFRREIKRWGDFMFHSTDWMFLLPFASTGRGFHGCVLTTKSPCKRSMGFTLCIYVDRPIICTIILHVN